LFKYQVGFLWLRREKAASAEKEKTPIGKALWQEQQCF
jgi:hypothetical protein